MLTFDLSTALEGEIEKPINEDGSVFFNGRKLMYSVTIICI